MLDRVIATMSEYGVPGLRELDVTLVRVPPSADLAALVERHWLVSWDVPPERDASVTLLPHPSVNLAFSDGVLAVHGVPSGRFTHVCVGEGRAFGVKFRPGAFLPLLGSPVADLTVLPAEMLWGRAARDLAARLGPARSVDEFVAPVEAFLRDRRPEPDPQVELVGRIVAALLRDRTIQRVGDVVDRFGLPARTLQRLFRRYVGVSPKQVLRRYRLHEAAAALAAEHDRPWADVAADLGYFDQSHFIHDFTAAVGLGPAEYAKACRPEPG